ncbi:MAG TPA: alpha/beta hydrolase [Acidimicrobiales bacterium]|nr:alpha/beta hydrolase [Acidimicrobiales bacterium]
MDDTRVLAGDGVEIAIHDLGGHGEPALVAHATSFHGRCYQLLAGELAGAFRSYAPDLRGHGASGAPPHLDFDWNGFRDDVVAAVRGLGLERPVGIGHSCGGAALLLAEAQYPGTFAALYCYEPIVFDPGVFDPDRIAEHVGAARRRRADFDSGEAALERYRDSPLGVLAPLALEAYVEHGFEQVDGGVRLRCLPEYEALIYEASTRSDAGLRLAEVTCPVTVAYGTTSGFFGAACLPLLAEGLPDVRLAALEGLGHLGPLEDPGAVARSIIRVVERAAT